MKLAAHCRQLSSSKELRIAILPCLVIPDLLDDLATLPTSTTDYGNTLRDAASVCSTFMFTPVESLVTVSCRLHDMVVDSTHNVTLFANRNTSHFP
eukprot:jgi/Tetstr1/463836/TSEL_008650.t1